MECFICLWDKRQPWEMVCSVLSSDSSQTSVMGQPEFRTQLSGCWVLHPYLLHTELHTETHVHIVIMLTLHTCSSWEVRIYTTPTSHPHLALEPCISFQTTCTWLLSLRTSFGVTAHRQRLPVIRQPSSGGFQGGPYLSVCLLSNLLCDLKRDSTLRQWAVPVRWQFPSRLTIPLYS